MLPDSCGFNWGDQAVGEAIQRSPHAGLYQLLAHVPVSVSIRASACCLRDVTWASSQHGALRILRPLRKWLGASSISRYAELKLYSCVCNPSLEVTKHHKVTQICGTTSLSAREISRPLHRWPCYGGGRGYCSCFSLSCGQERAILPAAPVREDQLYGLLLRGFLPFSSDSSSFVCLHSVKHLSMLTMSKSVYHVCAPAQHEFCEEQYFPSM